MGNALSDKLLLEQAIKEMEMLDDNEKGFTLIKDPKS